MLELEAAVKQFANFRLGPISLALPPGRAYGLLGPNGAGKTTFLNLIAAQLRLSSGGISLDGRPLRWGDAQWKKHICLIRENPSFYEELTVAQTMRLAASLYRTWDREFAADVMNRLSVDSHQIVGTMSKGTKVKLGLVVALAFHAKVLILDEPSAGLDPTARAELQELLLEIKEGNPEMILIISSHIFEDIERVAQHIIVLRNGQVVLSSSFTDLAASSIISLPATTGRFDVPEAQLTWTHKGNRYLLVRNEDPVLRLVEMRPSVVILPAINNLSLIYRASEADARQ